MPCHGPRVPPPLEEYAEHLRQQHRACDGVQTLSLSPDFPMYTVPLSAVLQMVEIKPHETGLHHNQEALLFGIYIPIMLTSIKFRSSNPGEAAGGWCPDGVPGAPWTGHVCLPPVGQHRASRSRPAAVQGDAGAQ